MRRYLYDILRSCKGFETNEERTSRCLAEGIYDVTDIDFLQVNERNITAWQEEEVLRFISCNPEACIAHSYSAATVFLLAKRPQLCSSPVEMFGSNLKYGAANVIKNCPSDLLILIESDDD